LSCKLCIRKCATETSFLERSEDLSEGGFEPAPGVVGDKVRRVDDEWSVVCVQLERLVRRTSPLPAWTHESRVC